MSNNVTENIIEFPRDSKTASVTFCQGRFITKIKKLAKKYPDECEIIRENKDGSILAHVPVKWIKISKIERNFSDERLEELRNRFKNTQVFERNGSISQDNALEDN